MSQKLAGSVCMITGASAGIGRACALSLAREGASLVLVARRKPRLDELVEIVHTAGGRAITVVGDVREATLCLLHAELLTRSKWRVEHLRHTARLLGQLLRSFSFSVNALRTSYPF